VTTSFPKKISRGTYVVNVLTFENAFKANNHDLHRELNSVYADRADFLGQVAMCIVLIVVLFSQSSLV
jgi:hypothetical protein